MVGLAMYSGTAALVLDMLNGYELTEVGPGKFRSNSPLRTGSNSHAFTLILQDDEHGAYFDHVSHEQGSLYHLAQQLNIPVEQPAVPAETKRSYASLEDYAAAHGITAEALRQAGWYETLHHSRRALAFKTATGTRWRFLDGDQPYYISPKGYKACWYGLTPSLVKQLSEGGALVLCNGEISTVAARQYGVAAACVTGGEKALPPDLIEELKVFLGADADYIPPIIVAFDCDPTGQRASKIVTRQLREAGFIARAVDLGLGGKGDLADFCMLNGADVRRQLNMLPALDIDEPDLVPHPQRSWYIMPAADLKKLPPIEWIVPGEIPDRSITVLFGSSGAGKSFLALDYALNLAQDEPVLYMAGEGEYGYRQRVAAWCQHHGKQEGQLFMCIGAVQLLEEGDLQAFLDENLRIKPRMVIIDTMARSMVGSDENSTRDMGLFIKACEDVKRTLDCAVLVIHHTNKGGVYERGNSALRGASDAMIKVSVEDDLIAVECAKTKDAQAFPTRYMKLLTVPVQLGDELVESAVMVGAEKVMQTPDDPLTPNQEKVLHMLLDEEHGANRGEIAEVTRIPYSSLQRVMVRLRKLGYIQQASKAAPFTITVEGQQRIVPSMNSAQVVA